MGISGKALSDKILACLRGFDLNLTYLRGQCYDGAGNMAGATKGTAALITKEYPLALYLHCASHKLNLAVIKSLQITSVRNMMGIVGRIYQFFAAHPKRQRALETAILNTQPESTVHKLKDMCRTRWIQHIDAIDVFQLLYKSIIACFESICTDGPRMWSSDSITDARCLQLSITTTEFICAQVITNVCLKYVHALTLSLQTEAKDLIAAINDVDTVISTLENVRENIETYHSCWFQVVESLCNVSGIVPSIKRVCGQQTQRSNTPAETPLEYSCRTISIPLFDHLLAELKCRFSLQQKTALNGFALVPSILLHLTPEDRTHSSNKLGEMYKTDLPFPNTLETEFHCWITKWQKQSAEHGESSPTETIKQTSTAIFPNIRVLLAILCTLPVTSCSAERSFSGLKRIKTATRSSMTTSRLTGLSLLHIHRDIPIDIDTALDELSRRHPRRMQMLHILED